MKKSPLLILFFTVFIDLIGFGIVLPLLPNYARELGTSPLLIGAIVSSYSLMQFFFAPLWGSLSDRIGRKPVFLISIFTSVISYFLFAHSHSTALLLFSRVLAGIGSANISTAQAYIADTTDQSNRSKAMGLIGAAFGLGFIFGPPLGGILKTHYGIESVGYVAAALSLLDLILTFFLLPESLKQKKEHSEIKFFDLNNIITALKSQPSNNYLAINFIYIFAFVNMQVSIALLCKERYAMDDKTIGYLFAFLGFVSALLQGGLIGRLSKKFSDNKLLLAGTFAMLLGIVGIPFIPAGSAAAGLELIPIGLLGLGNGLISPTNSSLFSLSFADGEQGEKLGVLQSVGALARIIGPFSGSILYGIDPHAPYLMGGLFLIVAIFLAWKNVLNGQFKAA